MNNILVFSRHTPLKRSLTFAFPKSLLKIISVIFIITVSVSLIFYLFQISSMLKASFLLNSYEDKLVEINEQNRALEIKLSQVISLNNVSALIQKSDFETIENIRHIEISRDSITARRMFINR